MPAFKFNIYKYNQLHFIIHYYYYYDRIIACHMASPWHLFSLIILIFILFCFALFSALLSFDIYRFYFFFLFQDCYVSLFFFSYSIIRHKKN